MCLRVRDDGDAGVVGHVEPLVGVEGPRVGPLRPLGQVRHVPGRSDPESERSVDVMPGVGSRHEIGDLGDRVEGARVHLTGLSDHDGGAGPAGERRADRVGKHATEFVGGDEVE